MNAQTTIPPNRHAARGSTKGMPMARTIALLGLLAALGAAPASAQIFNSGSTGIDGALDFGSTPTMVLFDPATLVPPRDVDGDNIYHFTTINIPVGVTVRLRADILGSLPVVWLATGHVQIDGFLELSGEFGHNNSEAAVPALAGAGGFAGGVGGTALQDAQAGNGPGGGAAALGEIGAGAGHAVAGTASGSAAGGIPYGNNFLLPIIGGSGGGGGAFNAGNNGGGGGGGGGAIMIASSDSIGINGSIYADGGQGGSASLSGGAGSGGAIRLMAPLINGGGVLSARNNQFYTPSSMGRIRLEAFQQDYIGQVLSPALYSVPIQVFPSADSPTVRIASVDGVLAPASPKGSFLMPDITINDAAAVTLVVEASNIPLGTQVNISIFPEIGAVINTTTTPLAGTLAASTATATATFPHGFSRGVVRATWTP